MEFTQPHPKLKGMKVIFEVTHMEFCVCDTGSIYKHWQNIVYEQIYPKKYLGIIHREVISHMEFCGCNTRT